MRNILASPLSGRVDGTGPAGTDVRGLVADLDAGLRADPSLADLPGRILFSLDDGRGDVSGLGADIGVHATGDDEFALVLGGDDTGVRLGRADAVDVMLAAARAFRDARDGHWRVTELPGGAADVLDRLSVSASAPPLPFWPSETAPIGLSLIHI